MDWLAKIGALGTLDPVKPIRPDDLSSVLTTVQIVFFTIGSLYYTFLFLAMSQSVLYQLFYGMFKITQWVVLIGIVAAACFTMVYYSRPTYLPSELHSLLNSSHDLVARMRKQ